MLAKSRKKPFDTRFGLQLVAYIFLFLLLIARLFKVQILDHAKYSYAADSQHWSQNELPALRGDIFTADNYLLAGMQTYYLLYAEPKKVHDIKSLVEKLADFFAAQKYDEAIKYSDDVLETTASVKKDLVQKYTQRLNQDLLWIPIEHTVSPDKKDAINALNLEGIGFQTEPVRFYPEDALASHILGFVASDENGESRGYFGLEGEYDPNLKGRRGFLSEEVDAMGIPLLIGDSKKTDAIQGSTLLLTINRSVQNIIEQKLKEGVLKYGATSGSVIVMDPFTGSIIALANYPTYSPGHFNDIDTQSDIKDNRKKFERQNLAIAQTYEPGSIMKPLTVATAIDLGKITPDTTYVDDGPVNYSGAWINNWDGKHYGKLNIIELLQKSNNIGAAWVGHQVGSRDIYNYFDNFGLGHNTNIDLEGETSGILRNYKDWTDIDLANISFGQGISATPLQMLNAINVMANGGFLMQPRVVSKIVNGEKVVELPIKVIRRVITKKTSDTMIELLEKAAVGGEAKYFVLKNFKIAGKTGTAQIPVNGKYDPNLSNASFVGFMSGSKKYSMIVKLEKPHTSIFASETAVPLWMDITNELIKYFGLFPDRQ